MPNKYAKKSKKKFDHAIQRCSQRFNLDLSREDCDELMEMVKEDKCLMLPKKDGGNRRAVLVKYHNRHIKFLFDKKSKRICTVMKPSRRDHEMINRLSHKEYKEAFGL